MTSAQARRSQVAPLQQVDIAPLAPERFEAILTAEQADEFADATTRGRALLAGRAVWSISSTARGGGVAEMLHSLLAYARGAGIDARWAVIGGEPDFFRVTKRIHNHLHGSPGDGGPLGAVEREIYETCTSVNAERLVRLVRRGDVVVLHDPQTAGLVAPLREAGAHVVWRAHIGLDLPNDRSREAWAFLLPYVDAAQAYVFSRSAFAWEGLPEERVTVIPPSIDPFSPKNQELDRGAARAIMHALGLAPRNGSPPVFQRQDGSPGRVDRRPDIVEEAPLPAGVDLVAQVSRWDRLKDPLGVMEGFIDEVAEATGAHLLLAGPETAAVADDPEGAEVLRECVMRWEGLAPEVRGRIHLAMLPMADAEENAAMVNAIQRSAAVVVQKSLAEGFGLTVAEAMWKGRPVVASRVGGIQDQIVDGDSGCLVDPTDLSGFGAAVTGLLLDPDRAAGIGARAAERVRSEFLGVRHLRQYVDLFTQVIAAAEEVRS